MAAKIEQEMSTLKAEEDEAAALHLKHEVQRREQIKSKVSVLLFA
ncbi:unnamed protein product [Protopolystoma xenopodis]|uniref:Uncharacterized protein n=1 Tax=Protopolystoma xenopodis TaxID=117903 RepID=A0A3S5C8V2_9PLAT|nr:unnamed protein product [Protopolystoma xenopodis]